MTLAERAPDDANLFADILFAPDRDHCPGARPIVSFRDDDEPNYLTQIGKRARRTYALERRGHYHGHWAELHPKGHVPPIPGRRKLEAILSVRWHAARPIFLSGLLRERLDEDRGEIQARARWLASCSAPEPLVQWLEQARVEPPLEIVERDAERFDPERDIVRAAIRWRERELWLKASRLSTHEDDASLRVRFSFGKEGDEDASADEERHQAVSELVQRLLPESRWLQLEPRLQKLLQRFCGRECYFTQHIAYWNAPQGGALLHHDAFDEPFETRQLGVCYAQLSGRTAWIALSLDDLVARTAEFAGLLAEGEMPWIADELDLPKTLALCADEAALRRELASPGCGALGPLVHRGPEFTSLLVDAGHALLLGPGDVVLLPNHGLGSTAMHSVFCAGPEPKGPRAGYGLSMAIRGRGPIKSAE